MANQHSFGATRSRRLAFRPPAVEHVRRLSLREEDPTAWLVPAHIRRLPQIVHSSTVGSDARFVRRKEKSRGGPTHWWIAMRAGALDPRRSRARRRAWFSSTRECGMDRRTLLLQDEAALSGKGLLVVRSSRDFRPRRAGGRISSLVLPEYALPSPRAPLRPRDGHDENRGRVARRSARGADAHEGPLGR
jgi:hypothetical protein